MVTIYNADAIVVRVRDFQEADKLVTLFTRERGKVQAIARGARRPRSRLAAVTQLFTHCRVQCYGGRNLDTLSQAEITESFRLLREDLTRMAYGTYLCELTDAVIQEDQSLEDGYLLLLTSLHLLATAGVDAGLVSQAFVLKLLALLGLRPVLHRCATCQNPLPAAELRFSPALGGALCNRCYGEGERVLLIGQETLVAMRDLLDGDLRQAPLLQLEPGVGAEINRVLEAFVEWRLEKRLRSLEFLQTVRTTGR